MATLGFDVRKSDADVLASWIGSFVGSTVRALGGVASAGRALGGVEGFVGAAADASRAYWEEVHAPVLLAAEAAAEELLTRYGEYLAALDGVDAARDARFGSDALSGAEADFGLIPASVSEGSASLASALGEIADIVELSVPSEADLVERLFGLADSPRACREGVAGVEDFYVQSAAALDTLASELERALSFAGSVGDFGSYAPGSAQGAGWPCGLVEALVASRAYAEGASGAASGAYSASLERAQARYEEELAKQREDHGRANVILGIASLFVGGTAIVFSGGTATLFVAPVMAFGSAQIVEGVQDAHYGS